ncbi:9340_t:CDS:1, partial [Scutellospora calospora]
FSPKSELGHNPSSDEYKDQYWTLIPGTGKRSGYYRIENVVTKWSIFSRFHPELQLGHNPNSGDKYDDQYWVLVPGTGKRSGYFRIESYVTKWSIFSRFSPRSELWHYLDSGDQYDDQYWTFIFEDMVVESIEYKIDEGKIANTAPVMLLRQTLLNDTDLEQQFSSDVNESVKQTSTFEYSSGFTVKVGMEFKSGVPGVAESGFSVEASTSQTWTFGKSTEFEKTYVASFPIKASKRTKIFAEASIKKATLSVPFIMHLKSKATGVKVDTHGIYSGVTTWDLTYYLSQQGLK